MFFRDFFWEVFRVFCLFISHILKIFENNNSPFNANIWLKNNIISLTGFFAIVKFFYRLNSFNKIKKK